MPDYRVDVYTFIQIYLRRILQDVYHSRFIAEPKDKQISVALADWQASMGVSEGWED